MYTLDIFFDKAVSPIYQHISPTGPYTITVLGLGLCALSEEERNFLTEEWDGRRMVVTVNNRNNAKFFLRDVPYLRHITSLMLTWEQNNWMIQWCRDETELEREIINALDCFPHLETIYITEAYGRDMFRALAARDYKNVHISSSHNYLDTYAEELHRNGHKSLQSFSYKSTSICYHWSIKLLQIFRDLPHLRSFSCNVSLPSHRVEETNAMVDLILHGNLEIFEFNPNMASMDIFIAVFSSRIRVLKTSQLMFPEGDLGEKLGVILRETKHLQSLHCGIVDDYYPIIRALEEENTTLIHYDPQHRKRADGSVEKIAPLLKRNILLLNWTLDKYTIAPPRFQRWVKLIISQSYCSSLLSLLPRELLHNIIRFLLFA